MLTLNVFLRSSVAASAFVLFFAQGCSQSPERKTMVKESDHKHDFRGPVHVTTPAYQRLYEFHGHVGPYVVLGFRAGKTAREILQSPGYFDLTAHVTCPLHTPTSCFIDGVQLGSGCTVGKRNLTFTDGSPISCTFTDKEGERVRIVLKEGLPAAIKSWIEENGVEETGKKVLALPREEVFTVEK